MCNCFRDRTIRVEQHTNSGRPPSRNYRFIRYPSSRSRLSPSSVLVRRPSPELQPSKVNFYPPKVSTVYSDSSHHDNRGRQRQQFHPLPPIIHQYPPHQQQLDSRHLISAPVPPDHHNRLEWSNKDSTTRIIDDHPEAAVVRLPKHGSHGGRLIRVHRSHPHPVSSPRTYRGRSGEGWKYHAHNGSDGSKPDGHWDGDGDSWAEDGNGQWSDGGDSLNGDRRQVGRRGYYLS